MKRETPWTAEEVAELTRRWGAGQSVRTIRKAMGRSAGSITGKAARIGLEARPSPIAFVPRMRAGACPFPTIRDGTPVACGKPLAWAGDYCPEHHVAAYCRSESRAET